jgi:hypothetical protein
MPTPNRFGLALEKLAAEPPSTKIAMIRSLLPEIEAALASGKTWKQVWQSLADDALDIRYETLRTYFQRVLKCGYPRRQRGKASNSPACVLRKHRMAWRMNRTVIPLIVESVHVFDWVLRLWTMGQAVTPG